MDLLEITDEELLSLALEENEDAKNILVEKYKYIIDINLKKYGTTAKMLGVDYKDLYSEGLYALSDALLNYRQGKEATVATFINVCVARRLNKCLIKSSRIKNKMVRDAYSLDYVYEQFGIPLMDIISDNSKNDPLVNITKEESYEELLNSIKSVLSEFEFTVFSLMVNGLDYNQIALILEKNPKQIDNTMQRLRTKTKNILELRKNA
ncbi:MAG: hypothetical protein RSE17_03585 [Bacilli bacterium]